jgi:hypothetical protein
VKKKPAAKGKGTSARADYEWDKALMQARSKLAAIAKMERQKPKSFEFVRFIHVP